MSEDAVDELQIALANIPEHDYDARRAVIDAHNARQEALRVERNAAVLAALHASWFEGVVGVFIDPTIQNQEIAADGTVLLGIGRRCDASFTFHELGHFLEIDTRRMGKKDWGLRFPRSKWFSYGRYGGYQEYFPKTYQGLLRELRVVAIQDVLADHFDPEGHVKRGRSLIEDELLLYLVVGAWLCPGNGKDGKQAWCLRQYAKLRKQYTYESLHAEFQRRVAILKRRMQARARRAAKVQEFLEAA